MSGLWRCSAVDRIVIKAAYADRSVSSSSNNNCSEEGERTPWNSSRHEMYVADAVGSCSQDTGDTVKRLGVNRISKMSGSQLVCKLARWNSFGWRLGLRLMLRWRLKLRIGPGLQLASWLKTSKTFEESETFSQQSDRTETSSKVRGTNYGLEIGDVSLSDN